MPFHAGIRIIHCRPELTVEMNPSIPRTAWIKSFWARIQKRMVEWDRKRIDEDSLAETEREKMRAILQGRATQPWLVQRTLSD